MTEPMKASDGSLFVQLGRNDIPEYLACVDMDAIPDPRGGSTLLRCRDNNGDFVTVGETIDEPDQISTTVTAWVYPQADILDRLSDKKCNATLYALMKDCGKRGQFNNWARGDIVTGARIASITGANYVMRVAGDPATRALEFTGRQVYHLRNKVSIKRQAIAETTDLNAIALDLEALCAGDCGESQESGEVGYIVGDAPAGSPTDRADVWNTVNAGADWTNIPGAAAHPFVAGQDIHAAVLFDLDRSVTRRLVAREIVGGEPLKLAYSDDNGATWTLVVVGSTNGEGVVGAKALVALDRDHIWVATSEGNVYFSDNGGISFDLQSGANSASGGESLNALRFIDVDNGYAVGDAGAIIATDDAGDTWSAIADPSGGDNILSLAVFSPFSVLVGTDADGLYLTLNSGVTWTLITFTGQGTTGDVKIIEKVNDQVLWMAHNPASGQGYIHRSISQGKTWERYTTPVNAGFNDLVGVDVNHAFAVGNTQAGTGVVLKIAA